MNKDEPMEETVVLDKELLGSEQYNDRLFIYEVKAKLYGGYVEVYGNKIVIKKGPRDSWVADPIVIERTIAILNLFYNSNVFPRGLIDENTARTLASELRRWLLVEYYRLRCQDPKILTHSGARLLAKGIADHFFFQITRSISGFGYDREKMAERTVKKQEEIL